MNPAIPATPVAPAVTPTPVVPATPALETPPANPIKSTLLSSLQLAITPVDPDFSPPVPTEVKPSIFSEARMCDIINHISETPVTPAPVPATPVVPATPGVVVVEPTPAPQPGKLKSFPVEEIPPPPPDHSYNDPVSLSHLGDLSDLNEDERQEVELARFAETSQPTRYANRSKATLEYIRNHRKFCQDNGTDTENLQDDSRYQSFVKANRPEFSSTERSKLLTSKIKEETKQEVLKELGGSQIKKMQEELRELKIRPIVDRTLTAFGTHTSDLLDKADDQLTQTVNKDVLAKAKAGAEEFISISAQLKRFDSGNPVHVWLSNFIEEQGQLYARSKDPGTKRGNRTFVPRSQFAQLAPKDAATHFTFTDEDILHLISVNAAEASRQMVTQERTRLESLGYVPRQVAPAARPATPPAPTPTPAPRAAITSAPSQVPVTPAGPAPDPFFKFIRDNATRVQPSVGS